MPVLVTRPQPQADLWTADLQSAGIDALALPLIHIGPPGDPQPVQQTWHTLDQLRLLVFVSPAAVAGFFALHPGEGAGWPARTLAAGPGPGTAQALREAGVPPGCIVEPAADAGQFDSETLWETLRGRLTTAEWAGATVRIVGGSETSPGQPPADSEAPVGRTWLTEQMFAAGARVDKLAAYRRGPAQLDAEQWALLQRAQAEPAAYWWLFSSSEAIDYLDALLGRPPGTAPATLPRRGAVVTHPRIAERARAAGFDPVCLTRPTLPEVVRALHELKAGSDTPSLQSPAT